MTNLAPPRSVAVLDSALAYTHVALQRARTSPSDLPTPCAQWDLGRLLTHMDDDLDAFTEAATGRVAGAPSPATMPVAARVGRLQDKACALLGTWSTARPTPDVGIGDQQLPTDLLVMAAALEIAVHGWDVGQVVAGGPPIPEELAARLLPVAQAVVGPEDRPARFAPAATPPRDASYDERLRAFLGR
jgi:uncharacterized protein (TIGR03086 family)